LSKIFWITNKIATTLINFIKISLFERSSFMVINIVYWFIIYTGIIL